MGEWVNSALLTGSTALAGVIGYGVGAYQRVAIARVPARVPRRPWVEAVTALAFAAVTALTLAAGNASPATLLALCAFLWFAAVGVALVVIDLETHRLPDAIVLPSYAVAIILFALASALDASWEALLRAALGGAALFGFYLVLRILQPRGMGMGDVKLAGLVGIHLAWIGWSTLLVGAFAAFVLGGLFGVGLLITRRAKPATAIPFGPWMIAGAWVGIASAEWLS
jgi:leader peptidase (prepilin peptidase) / N-methyltransferase